MTKRPPLSCRPSEEVFQAINHIGEETQLTNSYIISQILIYGLVAYQRGDFRIPPPHPLREQNHKRSNFDRRRAREQNHGVEATPLPEDQTALRNDR